MTVVTVCSCSLLILLAAIEWTLGRSLIALFRKSEPDEPAPPSFPRAAILMGLKGADPFLLQGLTRLIQQDYPEYEIHIVIDSDSDPAWDVVRQAIEQTGSQHVYCETYADLPENGLVNSTNSKLMQSLRKLDDDIEVVAMADGDNVPHAGWLRDLIRPLLTDPKIAATYGNRWFIPPRWRLGSMVRYLWNAAAIAPMHFQQIPWGGCFAIRQSVVREFDLIDRWSQVMAFDAVTASLLHPAGYRLQFVPSLMMVNREECSLPFAINFIRRQLTWTRLYHPQFAAVMVQAFIVTGLTTAAALLMVVGLVTGNGIVAGCSAAALGLYLAVQLCGLYQAERHVRRMAERHGDRGTDWVPVSLFGKLAIAPRFLFAFAITIWCHLVSVLLARYSRRVHWRGLILEIHGPDDIRTIENRPAALAEHAVGTSL